ncbi:hypothetical protein G9463_10900 [Haloarcula sp. JP-Z28]|uniref:hypothetical protein n=1 Tax=Haloarcula sp. JP-Z28 TaxID=2716715 RepID=UPI001404F13D|nr:hypothetical protein [Haloarcula sp. JP-Z28]NHN63801.1 hypothetical protein [Haloarcula sp. JP-Z28]
MSQPSDYVEIQYEVAKLIDSNKELTTEEFVKAAREERAISMLDSQFGDIVDLSLIKSQPGLMEEIEEELSAAVGGNPPKEYGIMENGLAGYVVHLTELIDKEHQMD